MKWFVVVALGIAATLGGAVSAGSFQRYYVQPATAPVVQGGMVSAEGHRERGDGFTVARVATGTYSIRFERGYLGPSCAGMVVTSIGPEPVQAIAHPVLCQPTAAFSVVLSRKGQPVDSGFQFIAVSQRG